MLQRFGSSGDGGKGITSRKHRVPTSPVRSVSDGRFRRVLMASSLGVSSRISPKIQVVSVNVTKHGQTTVPLNVWSSADLRVGVTWGIIPSNWGWRPANVQTQ